MKELDFYPVMDVVKNPGENYNYFIDPDFASLFDPEDLRYALQVSIELAVMKLKEGDTLSFLIPPDIEFYITILVNDHGVVKVSSTGVESTTREEVISYLVNTLSSF